MYAYMTKANEDCRQRKQTNSQNSLLLRIREQEVDSLFTTKMNEEYLDSPEVKDNNNFQNVIKFQQDVAATVIQQPNVHLKVDELVGFLEKHFDVYRKTSSLKKVLPLIHLSLSLYARQDYLDHDIGMMLLHFYENHNEDENDLLIFVQILHQVLFSLDMYGNNEITFSTKVFMQLIKQMPTLTRRTLISNIAVCLQLYLKMFPGDKEIMQTLWTDLSQRLNADSLPTKIDIDILLQFIDDFFNALPNLWSNVALLGTMQNLLKSNVREERKCGYFLLKKMAQSFVTKLKEVEHTKHVEKMWTFYITILENLEENQSHLILPSLKALNELIESKQVQSAWLKILFHRILSHKNNLVLRWSIEFFMIKFTCASLDKDVLRQLLESLNSNVLYNHEGYFIDKKYFSSFLQGDISSLYKEFGEINWKSVPLCNFLLNLLSCQAPDSMAFEQVLKIACRVRTLTDIYIRQKTALMLNEHLHRIVEKMTMEQYVTYIENLLTASDKFNVFKVLYKKALVGYRDRQESIFQKRFYEIALNNLEETDLKTLISFLEQTPVKYHGWLSFLTFHFGQLCSLEKDNKEELQKRSEWYGIYSDLSDGGLRLEGYHKFALRLFHHPKKDELEQCKIAIITVYINSLRSLDGLDEETFTQILLPKLPTQAVRNLFQCLGKTTQVLNSWIISRLIDLASESNYIDYNNLWPYLEKNRLCDAHVKAILEKCPRSLLCVKSNILKYLNMADFNCSDIKKGESRIEECYRYYALGPHTTFPSLTELWYSQLHLFGDKECVLYLLDCHKDISKKKQRYFANSHEHRLKMRIAAGISIVMANVELTESVFDNFWNIILNENNQLNITYIYEYLVATMDKRENLMLQKLKEAHHLTSSQQISIMSIVYNHCMCVTTVDSEKQQQIISNLLGFTMGANFQTRLFAQMILYKLLSSERFDAIQSANQILYSIETATKQKLTEHLYDIRLFLYIYTSSCDAWRVIKFVTKVPYDELENSFPTEFNRQEQKCRNQFSMKSEAASTNDVDSLDKDMCNNQLQRKMNPSTEVLQPNNLLVYPVKEMNAEMFVIASLIDKLPNLGGIARTCEVLGIRNIVMDSKRYIEENDFKNLSMTAEKCLNIIEVKKCNLRDFIIIKQKEGFAVIGAEQTSDSDNFVNFKFPPKCILLLGHEKDGIPPNLLGLLDHAVEIPQFGQVRSLNVHVTGALFMWEYCKQHLAQ